MEIVVALVVLIAVAAFVAVPLRRPDRATAPGPSANRAVLEARKDSKYAEIKDAQLDHATGKLSDVDFERTDRELRAEAIAILRKLDALD